MARSYKFHRWYSHTERWRPEPGEKRNPPTRPEDPLSSLPGNIIKGAMDDIKEFFGMKLLADPVVKRLHQSSRFRYVDSVRSAAQSLAWILSDDQPYGTTLSFEECCNAQCINHETMREQLLKFVKQGPKAHLLYLRDRCEELLGV